MADAAPFGPPEAGDFEAFVAVDPARLTDGELVDRMLLVQRMRCRLDAAAVAVTDRFDAGMVGAADGARTTAAWVTQRVGVSYGCAKADVELARELRDRHHIRTAHAEGRLTRDQVRALLKVRSRGLEEAFDACEQVLVDEVTSTCTLNAGRRFLARWEKEVRERFGIPEPDGADPSPAAASPTTSAPPPSAAPPPPATAAASGHPRPPRSSETDEVGAPVQSGARPPAEPANRRDARYR